MYYPFIPLSLLGVHSRPIDSLLLQRTPVRGLWRRETEETARIWVPVDFALGGPAARRNHCAERQLGGQGADSWNQPGQDIQSSRVML